MESICKLKEIYRTLNRFEKDFHKSHGLTINEAMLLCCLEDGHARSAGELCDFIGLSGSRVSKIITSAENKEWISRSLNSGDRRQMIFTLTDKGKAKISRMNNSDLGLEEFFKCLQNSAAGPFFVK